MAANTIAYGFVGLSELMAQRVADGNVEQVWKAIQDSAVEWSRQSTGLLSSLVERTTKYKARIYLQGNGTLQPLDDNGSPLPVQPGSYYDVAYPIQGGGTAWGSNRVSRALMTVDEANRNTVDALARDADWMRRHILAALFDNATWVFSDPKNGSLTIQPLANGDTVEYLRTGGSAAVDTHQLAQAAAISDSADPFDDIYDELMEHPSNSGPVVTYVPTNLTASIEALTAFIPVSDPEIIKGIGSDRLAAPIDRGFGDEVLGRVDRNWIVEWRALPSNYMLAHAQGAGPVLAMREYEAPEIQGFFTERDAGDGNLQSVKMIRYAGFGVKNRVAAVVYRVGNGSYAIPPGYDAPLAV